MNAIVQAELKKDRNVLFIRSSSKMLEEVLVGIGLEPNAEIPTYSDKYTAVDQKNGGVVEVLPHERTLPIGRHGTYIGEFSPDTKLYLTSSNGKARNKFSVGVAKALVQKGIEVAIEVNGEKKGYYLV